MNRRAPDITDALRFPERVFSDMNRLCPGGDRATGGMSSVGFPPSSQPQGRTVEAHKPTETNQQTFARFSPAWPCWTLPEPPVSPMIPCGRRLFHFTACRDRTNRLLPYPCGLCHGRTWAHGASKHHCEKQCRRNEDFHSCCIRLRLRCFCT